MKSIEFNPANPSGYNDFIPEVENRRINILFWSLTGLIVIYGGYQLYKYYSRPTEKPQEKKERSFLEEQGSTTNL
jgi:hypothetical protein